MKRFAFIPLASAVALLAACTDTSTIAAPDGGPNLAVNLKGGKNAKPAFTDHVLTLQGTGAVSGLGNGDIFVGLAATANATATCTNPGSGAHQPPGQNPAPVQVTGGQAIPAGEIKNGNTNFDVTSEVPLDVGPRPARAGECPNSQWSYEVTDLAFTSATITIQQPQDDANPTQNIVLTVACTFTPATANGAVPAGTVSCTQTR